MSETRSLKSELRKKKPTKKLQHLLLLTRRLKTTLRLRVLQHRRSKPKKLRSQLLIRNR